MAAKARDRMTQETIAIIGAAIVLAGLTLYLARGLNEMRRDMADLRERMARLEGLFSGFTKSERRHG